EAQFAELFAALEYVVGIPQSRRELPIWQKSPVGLRKRGIGVVVHFLLLRVDRAVGIRRGRSRHGDIRRRLDLRLIGRVQGAGRLEIPFVVLKQTEYPL